VGHQLIVQAPGVPSGDPAIVADGIGMDLDQAGRLEDAAALGDVFQDGEDFLLGQVGAVQRGALAFGEPGPAGAAVEQPILAVLAQPASEGESSMVRDRGSKEKRGRDLRRYWYSRRHCTFFNLPR
jgi:hypothetical protein